MSDLKRVNVATNQQILAADVDSVSSRIYLAIGETLARFMGTKDIVVNGLDVVAGGGMNILVNPGSGWQGGSDNGKLLILGAASNIVVPAADPVNPRIDTIQIRFTETLGDSQSRVFINPLDQTTSNQSTPTTAKMDIEVQLIQGTPSGTPIAPNKTTGWMKIAEVTVPALAVSISDSNIATIDEISSWTNETTVSQRLLSFLAHTAAATLDHPDGSVTTAKITNLAITNGKIAALAVDTGKIADLAVTTAKIADLNVTSGKIAPGAVIAGKIGAAAVGATELQTDAVTTIKILDSNVTAGKLASDSVTTIKILDAAVTAPKLATDSVTTIKIVDGNVTQAKLQNAQIIDTGRIVDLAVTTAKIANLNVTTGKIADGAITTVKLDQTVSSEAVTTATIRSLAVTTIKINDLAVTVAKLNTNALPNSTEGHSKMQDGYLSADAEGRAKMATDYIQAGKIEANAITTVKILDANVTTTKIADLNVTTGKINDLAVTTGKINDLAVTEAKIGALAVTTGKIGDLAVTSAKLANASVLTEKLATTTNITSITATSQVFTGAGKDLWGVSGTLYPGTAVPTLSAPVTHKALVSLIFTYQNDGGSTASGEVACHLRVDGATVVNSNVFGILAKNGTGHGGSISILVDGLTPGSHTFNFHFTSGSANTYVSEAYQSTVLLA